jgi:hypothetical protein
MDRESSLYQRCHSSGGRRTRRIPREAFLQGVEMAHPVLNQNHILQLHFRCHGPASPRVCIIGLGCYEIIFCGENIYTAERISSSANTTRVLKIMRSRSINLRKPYIDSPTTYPDTSSSWFSILPFKCNRLSQSSMLA